MNPADLLGFDGASLVDLLEEPEAKRWAAASGAERRAIMRAESTSSLVTIIASATSTVMLLGTIEGSIPATEMAAIHIQQNMAVFAAAELNIRVPNRAEAS